MQDFKGFLKENYGITVEEFSAKVDAYDKRIIEAEWDCYVKHWIG